MKLKASTTTKTGTTGNISFGGGTLQYTSNNTTDYSSRFSEAANMAKTDLRKAMLGG